MEALHATEVARGGCGSASAQQIVLPAAAEATLVAAHNLRAEVRRQSEISHSATNHSTPTHLNLEWKLRPASANFGRVNPAPAASAARPVC